MNTRQVPSWVKVNPSSGEGNKSVQGLVEANTGEPRSATAEVVGGVSQRI